jgi:hypothetical protein
MKKLLNLSLIALVSTFLLNSCYDDKEETLYRFLQTNNCDTTNVTYSLTVAPIIQSNCAGCHTGASASGNLSLQNYAEITTAVNSRGLYERISNAANPMPPGGLMDACKIKQIKKWIDLGSPNN